MDVGTLKGRTDFVAKDAVFVQLRHGVVTGVESGRYVFHIGDANRPGQQMVHGAEKIYTWNGTGGGEGGHLGDSVDAGIGAAAALNKNWRFGKSEKDTLEFALHRHQTGLDLPAVEVGAVIGNGDADTPFGLISRHYGSRA